MEGLIKNRYDVRRVGRRVGVFCAILAIGMLVFVVYSHYYPVFSGPLDVIGRIGLAALLLFAALVFRRSPELRDYWLVPLAFLTALCAISVDYLLGISRWLIPAFGVDPDSPAGWTIDKVESSAVSILVILALNRISGNRLEALYFRRGNVKATVIVGALSFALIIAGLIPITELFFDGKNLSWARILPWTPWVLACSITNAFNEELIFRGLLFGRLEPLLGKLGTNIAVAIPFAIMHAGTLYSADILMFLAMLVVLSLAWGAVLQRSGSIWGSILFHAAMDIPIFVGIFSNV